MVAILLLLERLFGGGVFELLLNSSSVPGAAAVGGLGAGGAGGASGPGGLGTPADGGAQRQPKPWWQQEYEDVANGVADFVRDVRQTGENIQDDIAQGIADDIQDGRERTRQQQSEQQRRQIMGEDKK